MANLKILLLFISILNIKNVYSKSSYVSSPFVHVHKNKSINSITLVSLTCGQKVEILEKENEWINIKSGSFIGYVLERNLNLKYVDCLNKKYSKIYDKLDLNMSEIYKMGRLEDLFIYGESPL